MIVEVPSTEIIVEDTLDVSVGSCEVEVVDLADLDVTVSKKEYVITGDEIYIPMLYDDAPQWMKDLVQVVVDVAIDSNNTDLINNMTAIVSEFATSYVPLNQYTQSIIDLGDEDTRINGLITTLNSNLSDGLSSANAQIIEMQLTKASKSEVVAQIIQTLSAQLADETSSLGATIGRIDQAIADETSARASSFEVLTSSLEDTNLDVTANATATSLLNTYVGLELGAPNGTGLLADIVALASDVTTLSTELDNGTNTWAGADSTLENSLMTEISDEGARVESKFAYNNTLMLNGTSYSSGFGIATSLTSGSGLPTGQSEFWIKADKFKLMSANGSKKSSYSPFTVDSVTGEINFNGKVTFSNVTNVPQLGSTPQEVVDAVNSGQTTTINGPRITTGTITAAQIAADSISADKISSYNLTSTNAAIQDGLITNAKIANAAITSAKIGNAQITNAKIEDLSVSTLKIQDEAVIVPRSTTNTSLIYSPVIGHSVTIICKVGISFGGYNNNNSMIAYLKINGIEVDSASDGYVESANYILMHNTTFNAGTVYTISVTTSAPYLSYKISMIGTKK